MRTNRLAEIRTLYRISATALARESGVHRVTIHRIERGEEPSVSTALSICSALTRLAWNDLAALGADANAEPYLSVEDIFGADAEYLDFLVQQRESLRELAEIRAGQPDPLIPAAPFQYWLVNRSESDAELAAQFEVNPQRIAAIRNGKRKRVRQSLVDRAGVLSELYP